MEDWEVELASRELESLQSLQIFLNGHEANALILAVQLMRVSSAANKDLYPVVNVAEVAARKLQKLFLLSPVCYSVLQRGWELTEPNLTNQENDTNS